MPNQPARLSCPRCLRPPLEACSYEGHPVQVCPRCGGLWCRPANWDQGKLGPLPAPGQSGERAPDVRVAEPPTSQQILFGPEAAQRLAGVKVSTHPKLACPSCRTPLTALEVGGPDGCEIDQCDQCGGVWFDRGCWDSVEALHTWKAEQKELDRPTTWGEWAFQFFLGLPVEFNVPPRRFPLVTVSLIVVCVVCFLLQLAVGPEGWQPWALHPNQLWAGPALVTLVTSLFLHAGWAHLAGNMYFLYILGDNVEDVLGRWRYLVFYLGCGLAANLLMVVLAPDTEGPVLGASGAIAGVMAAYILLFRQARLTFMLIFWQFKVRAELWLGIWFAFQLLGAFFDPSGARTGVAYLDHVGGFVAGFLFIWPQQGALAQQHPLLRLLRTRKPSPVPAHA